MSHRKILAREDSFTEQATIKNLTKFVKVTRILMAAPVDTALRLMMSMLADAGKSGWLEVATVAGQKAL